MLFDVNAALAEIMADTPTTIATTATNRSNVAKVAGVAAGPCEISAPATPPGGAVVLPLHGPASRPVPAPSVPGNMVRLDWSGEWVRRDRWDAMSDLERHGPQGRLFCGKCWRYRGRDTALLCVEMIGRTHVTQNGSVL